MIKIKNAFYYEDFGMIEAGEYEYCECGPNGYPMIKVNGEWLDLASIEELI